MTELRSGNIKAGPNQVADLWRRRNRDDSFVRHWYVGTTSYRQGLVLQHYGFPTGWLDITCDPKVAFWFALTDLTWTPDGYNASHVNWQDSDRGKWPTVFVFPLVEGAHTFLPTERILSNADVNFGRYDRNAVSWATPGILHETTQLVIWR